MDVITYTCWDQSWTMLVKGDPAGITMFTTMSQMAEICCFFAIVDHYNIHIHMKMACYQVQWYPQIVIMTELFQALILITIHWYFIHYWETDFTKILPLFPR